MYYFIEEDNKILVMDTDLGRLTDTLKLQPHFAHLTIHETDREIVRFNNAFYYKDEIEKELKQAEQERINNLTMTKRVFALMLQEYGISYSQLKELIASNEQAQLEWDLCERLERKNSLLDIMAMKIGILPEQLDEMFKRANGEEV